MKHVKRVSVGKAFLTQDTGILEAIFAFVLSIIDAKGKNDTTT